VGDEGEDHGEASHLDVLCLVVETASEKKRVSCGGRCCLAWLGSLVKKKKMRSSCEGEARHGA
jgi:hypothetical protein